MARRLRASLRLLTIALVCLQCVCRYLRKRRPAPAACTLLLNVFSRPHTVKEALEHYDWTAAISEVVVLWASPLEEPPTVLRGFLHPVKIVTPPDASLNWRFYPWPAITSECVISMDDDWRMPLDIIERLVDIWHHGFQDQWIGLEHLGRNHVLMEEPLREKQVLYATQFWSQFKKNPGTINGAPFHSIVLPSGSVLAKKYFERYWHDRFAEMRDYVDIVTNCEDLLMNFVVSEANGKGPVMLRAWDRPIEDNGLWHRKGHLAIRTDCLQLLHTAFNKTMPLRYTTSRFDLEGALLKPSQLSYSSAMPRAYECDERILEEEGVCEFNDR